MSSSAKPSTARSRSAPACRRALRPTTSTSSARSALLSLPREVGTHPEDGKPIMAGIGRFGPYVQHGKTYANLETGDDVLNVGLNRAVTLIAEKKAEGPRKGRFGADPGRALGDHPDKGGAVVVRNGRYGPYVSHDGINATLPCDMAPETVTLDRPLPLLDARAARGTGRKKAAGQAPRPPRKAQQGRRPKPQPHRAKRKAGRARKAKVRKARASRRPPDLAGWRQCVPSLSIERDFLAAHQFRETHASKPPFPSKDELLAFIAEHPGKVGKREIARAFGMKKADRIALKQMLRDLADEGVVERRRKKLQRPGTLPDVVVADITGRDSDGEFIAEPAEWDEEGARLRRQVAFIAPAQAAARRGPASATARCCGSRDRRRRRRHPPQRPRHQAHRRASSDCSASSARSRAAADGSRRSTRSRSASESRSRRRRRRAQEGDLVAVEVAPRTGGYGLATAPRRRSGSARSGASTRSA